MRLVAKILRGSPSRALLLGLSVCLLCSCSLVRMRQSVKKYNASGVIAVKVTKAVAIGNGLLGVTAMVEVSS